MDAHEALEANEIHNAGEALKVARFTTLLLKVIKTLKCAKEGRFIPEELTENCSWMLFLESSSILGRLF